MWTKFGIALTELRIMSTWCVLHEVFSQGPLSIHDFFRVDHGRPFLLTAIRLRTSMFMFKVI